MTAEIFWAEVARASFPQGGDMIILVLIAMAIAGPLAFVLAYWDKKAEEARADARAFEGWAELIAEFGLDLDTDAQELTWRQRCHDFVDLCFDKAEVAREVAVKIAKTGLLLGAFVPVAIVAAAALTIFMVSVWVAMPLWVAMATHNWVRVAVENHKAKAAAAAEKAEAEARAEFKQKAEAAGFVHVDQVSEMIADAINQHEAKSHRFRINPAFERKLRPEGKALTKILVEFGAEDLSAHAQAVVRKSIEEMSISELREELGCGKQYNLRTLRARVRSARAS